MNRHFQIGARRIGDGARVFVVGDIGINHNGDLEQAKSLIDVAKAAGCDAVLWHKCAPELHLSRRLGDRLLETPWGTMTFLEYRRRLEWDSERFAELAVACEERDLAWGGRGARRGRRGLHGFVRAALLPSAIRGAHGTRICWTVWLGRAGP